MVKPTQKLLALTGSHGSRLIEAHMDWLTSLSGFADRCKAAGSSALQ